MIELSEAQKKLVAEYPPASADQVAFWWGVLNSDEDIPWKDSTIGALMSRSMVQYVEDGIIIEQLEKSVLLLQEEVEQDNEIIGKRDDTIDALKERCEKIKN